MTSAPFSTANFEFCNKGFCRAFALKTKRSFKGVNPNGDQGAIFRVVSHEFCISSRIYHGIFYTSWNFMCP